MLTHLNELLASHTPHDAAEAQSLASMRRWVTTLEQPFSRHQAGAHFTGSALVVDERADKIALLHHAKLNRWLQPGGHADPEDAGCMRTTALREAHEETGCIVRLHEHAASPLDVDVHLIPARGDEPAHHHLDLRFLVVATNPDALTRNVEESFAARWFTFDEAISLANDEPLRRLMRKGMAILRA